MAAIVIYIVIDDKFPLSIFVLIQVFTFTIIVMANICKIGHDHQAPFQVVVLVVLVVVQGQAVKQGKNKLPHGQYIPDPQYFPDSGSPIK